MINPRYFWGVEKKDPTQQCNISFPFCDRERHFFGQKKIFSYERKQVAVINFKNSDLILVFDIGNVEGGLVFAEIRKSSEEDGSRILLYMSLMR